MTSTRKSSVVQLNVDSLLDNADDNLVHRIQSGSSTTHHLQRASPTPNSYTRTFSTRANNNTHHLHSNASQQHTAAAQSRSNRAVSSGGGEEGYVPSSVRRELWQQNRSGAKTASLDSSNLRDVVNIRPSGVKQRAQTASLVMRNGGASVTPNPYDDLYDGDNNASTILGGVGLMDGSLSPDVSAFHIPSSANHQQRPLRLMTMSNVTSRAHYSASHFNSKVTKGGEGVQELPLEDIAHTLQVLQDISQQRAHSRLNNTSGGTDGDQDDGAGGGGDGSGLLNLSSIDQSGSLRSKRVAVSRPMSRMESEDRFRRSVNEALDREVKAQMRRKAAVEAEKLRSRTYTSGNPRRGSTAHRQGASPIPPRPSQVTQISPLTVDPAQLQQQDGGVVDAAGGSRGGGALLRSSVRRGGNPQQDTSSRLYQMVIRGGSRIASQARPSSSCGPLTDSNGTPLAAIHPLTRNIRGKFLNRPRTGDTSSLSNEVPHEREDGLDETAEENLKTLPSRLLEAVFKPAEDLSIEGLHQSPNVGRTDRRASQPDKALVDAFLRRSEDIEIASKKLAQKQQLRKGILGHIMALVNDSKEAKMEVKRRVHHDNEVRGAHRAYSAETVPLPPSVATHLLERAMSREQNAVNAPSPSAGGGTAVGGASRVMAKYSRSIVDGHPSMQDDLSGGDSPPKPTKNFLASNAADAKLEGHLRREERRVQLLEQEGERAAKAEEVRMCAEKERLEEIQNQIDHKRGSTLGRDRQWATLVSIVASAHTIHAFIAHKREEIAFNLAAKQRDEQHMASQRARYLAQSADSAERVRQLVAQLRESATFRRAINRWKYGRRIEAATVVTSFLRTIANNSKIQLQCRRLIEHIKILQRVVRNFLKRLSYRRALVGDYLEYFISERAVFSRQLCIDLEKEINKRKHKFALLPTRAGPAVAAGSAQATLSKGAVALDSALHIVTTYATSVGKASAQLLTGSRGNGRGGGGESPTNRGESPSGRSSIGSGVGGGGFPRVLAMSAYRYVLAVESYHLARTPTSAATTGGDLSDSHHHQTLVITSPPPMVSYNNNNPSKMVSPWSFILPSGTKGHMTNISTALSEIRRRKGLFPSESATLLGEDVGPVTTTGDSGYNRSAITSNPSSRPQSSHSRPQTSNSASPTNTQQRNASTTSGRLGASNVGGGGELVGGSSRPSSAASNTNRKSTSSPTDISLPHGGRRQISTTSTSAHQRAIRNAQLSASRKRIWEAFPPNSDTLFAASCLPSALGRFWRNPFSALYFAKETQTLPYSERLTTKLPPRIKDIVVRYFFIVESEIHKQRLQEWKTQYTAISAKLEWERELSEYGVAATLLPTSTTCAVPTASTPNRSPSTTALNPLSSTPSNANLVLKSPSSPISRTSSSKKPPVFNAKEAILQLLPPFPRRRCLPTENEARLIVLIGYALYYSEKKNLEEMTRAVTKRVGSVRTPEGRAALDSERQYLYAKTASGGMLRQHCRTQVRRLEGAIPGLTDDFVTACAGSDDEDETIPLDHATHDEPSTMGDGGGPRGSITSTVQPY